MELRGGHGVGLDLGCLLRDELCTACGGACALGRPRLASPGLLSLGWHLAHNHRVAEAVDGSEFVGAVRVLLLREGTPLATSVNGEFAADRQTLALLELGSTVAVVTRGRGVW